MVIYHTERALPRHPVTAVTRAYDQTADQKIIGSGNEDGGTGILLPQDFCRYATANQKL